MVTSPEVGLLLALGGTAALLFATLLLLNWKHRRSDARAARLRHPMEPMLASWAERPADAAEVEWLALLPRRDGRTALAACLEAVADAAPATAERAREALRRSGLAAREIALLRHPSAARRVQGCRYAGRLGDAGSVPLLVTLLRDRDVTVRREAIRALGELQAVEAVGDIAEAIEALREWSNLLLVMALIRMGPKAVVPIGALLRTSHSPAMTKALLQVTGRLGLTADEATICALAVSPEVEIRVEAVRALGCIPRSAVASDVCLGALADAEWPVRALAAWSLGRVGDERAVPRLASSMGDPAYWVRHHVAEAMAALGGQGEAALRRALEDENPFVRDMAEQALFMRALPAGGAA